MPSSNEVEAVAAALDIDLRSVQAAMSQRFVGRGPQVRPHPIRVHTPRRSARTWLRSTFNTTPRIIDGWDDLTDRMEPPEGTLEGFAHLHPEVPAERLALVWEALLQWVRLRGRRLVIDSRNGAPLPVRLCQPSLAVDSLWQQLVEDEATWRRLPELVQSMVRVPVRDHRSRNNLRDTYEQAYFDEFALRLPLLFQVDEALGIVNARLYRGGCVVEFCKEKSDLGRTRSQAGPACTESRGLRVRRHGKVEILRSTLRARWQ
jgi:hypothetical protein